MTLRNTLPYFAALFAVLLGALTAVVTYVPSRLESMDNFVHAFVVPFQTPAWSNAALVFTNFGSTAGIIAGLIIITVVFCHRPDVITRVWIALLGAVISGEYLKEWVHRARPDVLPWLQPITNSYSYPSGHSNGAMVFYGFLALLLYVHARTRVRRIFALVIPALFILLIGISRLVLNYHFASDVLGGFLLGGFWLTFSLSIPLYYEFYHQDKAQNAIHSEPLERPVL